MTCTQPGCPGSIVDGYCDVCGMAPSATPSPPANADPGSAPISAPVSTPSRGATSGLGSAPLGSSRTTGSRPTRRLAGTRTRLGAGLTSVPPIPVADPRQALMDPPVVREEKRFCAVCNAPVGRGRDGQPGRTKGFCAKCRTPFDFDPALSPGMLIGGQYEVVGALAHGGMGWIYLARDRNVNDRWVVLKGLLNAGDPDATRAAIGEKQYLAEVEHPLIVEIYNFVTTADGASYIVMEYVGGRSLNDLLKDRMKANGGAFSAIPVDQAIAYLVEILPAFSYLHGLGLLYCDFKPANVIQVGDGIKLIDLGGVRRMDDDVSPIYGTVGFQAPEVAADGPSVASDLYTVARTLAVLIFEFRGYQDQYVDSLPAAESVPVFAEHDSLYRWLLKGTAPRAQDRFQSAEEMRDQLLGVLREVIAANSAARAVSTSVASVAFGIPGAAIDDLDWRDLPELLPDPTDPMADFLQTVTAVEPADRLRALSSAPQRSIGVLLATADAALEGGDVNAAAEAANEVLKADPWEWRGVWMQGLIGLASDQPAQAIRSFNAVYGQLPGELAPKLALARACELGGEPAVAERMYALCSTADANYVAAASFGLARLAAGRGDRDGALSALQRIPVTSRAYNDARRKRAVLLAAALDPQRAIEDLGAAETELAQANLAPKERNQMHIQILESALAHVRADGDRATVRLGGVPATDNALRTALEEAYREAARMETVRSERIRLIDKANEIRPRTLV